VQPGYLCFPEGMHIVFYKIGKEGIDILGIPHQSMDVVRYLDE
jgi:toxin ParE1/3/4